MNVCNLYRHSLYCSRCLWALLALLLALLPGLALAQADALVVPADEQVQGDVVTIRRAIVIDGSVQGDVTSWTGAITVRGHVSGDVVSYTGPIDLTASAQVDGNVLVLSGAVEQDSEAQVAGRILGDVPLGSGLVASMQQVSGTPPATPTAWLLYLLISGAMLLLTLGLVTGGMLLWLRRTTSTSAILLTLPARAGALGLITTVLLALLLVPLSLLLALSLVGLPILALLLVLLQLPFVYGIAVLAHTLSLTFLRRIGSDGSPALPLALLIAAGLLLPILLLSMASLAWSAALFYLLASPGLGATILSRGGALALAPARAGA